MKIEDIDKLSDFDLLNYVYRYIDKYYREYYTLSIGYSRWMYVIFNLLQVKDCYIYKTGDYWEVYLNEEFHGYNKDHYYALLQAILAMLITKYGEIL